MTERKRGTGCERKTELIRARVTPAMAADAYRASLVLGEPFCVFVRRALAERVKLATQAQPNTPALRAAS